MKSKLVTLLLVLGVTVGGGTAAVLAEQGNGDGNRADNAQYRPGKGCGDLRHTHTGPPGKPGNDGCPPKP